MPNIDFSSYLYGRLPDLYRRADNDEFAPKEFREPLKRYLSTLGSGLNYSLAETENLSYLKFVDTCPEEYIPYLCDSLGVVYEPDIPIYYQRKFLKNAVMLNQRKGTKSAITYLARELSGYDSVVNIDNSGNVGVVLTHLKAPLDSIGDSEVRQGIIERYLQYYIPVMMDMKVVMSYVSESKALGILNQVNNRIIISPTSLAWEELDPVNFTDSEGRPLIFDGSILFDGATRTGGTPIHYGGRHEVLLTLKDILTHSYNQYEDIYYNTHNGLINYDGSKLFDSIDRVEQSMINNSFSMNINPLFVSPYDVSHKQELAIDISMYSKAWQDALVDYRHSSDGSILFDGIEKFGGYLRTDADTLEGALHKVQQIVNPLISHPFGRHFRTDYTNFFNGDSQFDGVLKADGIAKTIDEVVLHSIADRMTKGIQTAIQATHTPTIHNYIRGDSYVWGDRLVAHPFIFDGSTEFDGEYLANADDIIKTERYSGARDHQIDYRVSMRSDVKSKFRKYLTNFDGKMNFDRESTTFDNAIELNGVTLNDVSINGIKEIRSKASKVIHLDSSLTKYKATTFTNDFSFNGEIDFADKIDTLDEAIV